MCGKTVKEGILPTDDLFLFSFYMRGMSFIDMAYLAKCNLRDGFVSYVRRKTTNRNLWKTNTNKIVVSDPNNKIKSLVFNNTGSGALPPSKTCDLTNSWTVTGLDAATVGSFTSLNLTYNPADVTVGVENVIAVTSYDMSSICTIFT